MRLTALLLAALLPVPALAAPAFTGTDYSGIYDCSGDDAHEGKYTGVVTLALDRAQSVGEYGAYSFKLEVPGYGTYLGQAAAHGQQMAVHFALTDQSTRDYGTGIARFSRKNGKLGFHKYYYEPEFKGGNYGTEDCRRR